jgi:hypothetical protein
VADWTMRNSTSLSCWLCVLLMNDLNSQLLEFCM